ncbi:helix-turn-helix domain-containing protein [Aquimarina agarivorans]|uniref:helix-turn-helix domain-containing protein n=1 Tax=Aquimarina agarivorans TaxID=980584 RepID=UPI0002DBCF56|nr:helix-turn-helix transcriptional regulator [Aquimarina agarivorans]
MMFGELIRKHREEKGLPLRKIAAECDIDTSILSKIERSERFATSDIIPILSKSLDIEFKALQMLYLTEKINAEYGNEKYFEESINEILNLCQKNKRNS